MNRFTIASLCCAAASRGRAEARSMGASLFTIRGGSDPNVPPPFYRHTQQDLGFHSIEDHYQGVEAPSREWVPSENDARLVDGGEIHATTLPPFPHEEYQLVANSAGDDAAFSDEDPQKEQFVVAWYLLAEMGRQGMPRFEAFRECMSDPDAAPVTEMCRLCLLARLEHTSELNVHCGHVSGRNSVASTHSSSSSSSSSGIGADSCEADEEEGESEELHLRCVLLLCSEAEDFSQQGLLMPQGKRQVMRALAIEAGLLSVGGGGGGGGCGDNDGGESGGVAAAALLASEIALLAREDAQVLGTVLSALDDDDDDDDDTEEEEEEEEEEEDNDGLSNDGGSGESNDEGVADADAVADLAVFVHRRFETSRPGVEREDLLRSLASLRSLLGVAEPADFAACVKASTAVALAEEKEAKERQRREDEEEEEERQRRQVFDANAAAAAAADHADHAAADHAAGHAGFAAVAFAGIEDAAALLPALQPSVAYSVDGTGCGDEYAQEQWSQQQQQPEQEQQWAQQQQQQQQQQQPELEEDWRQQQQPELEEQWRQQQQQQQQQQPELEEQWRQQQQQQQQQQHPWEEDRLQSPLAPPQLEQAVASQLPEQSSEPPCSSFFDPPWSDAGASFSHGGCSSSSSSSSSEDVYSGVSTEIVNEEHAEAVNGSSGLVSLSSGVGDDGTAAATEAAAPTKTCLLIPPVHRTLPASSPSSWSASASSRVAVSEVEGEEGSDGTDEADDDDDDEEDAWINAIDQGLLPIPDTGTDYGDVDNAHDEDDSNDRIEVVRLGGPMRVPTVGEVREVLEALRRELKKFEEEAAQAAGGQGGDSGAPTFSPQPLEYHQEAQQYQQQQQQQPQFQPHLEQHQQQQQQQQQQAKTEEQREDDLRWVYDDGGDDHGDEGGPSVDEAEGGGGGGGRNSKRQRKRRLRCGLHRLAIHALPSLRTLTGPIVVIDASTGGDEDEGEVFTDVKENTDALHPKRRRRRRRDKKVVAMTAHGFVNGEHDNGEDEDVGDGDGVDCSGGGAKSKGVGGGGLEETTTATTMLTARASPCYRPLGLAPRLVAAKARARHTRQQVMAEQEGRRQREEADRQRKKPPRQPFYDEDDDDDDDGDEDGVEDEVENGDSGRYLDGSNRDRAGAGGVPNGWKWFQKQTGSIQQHLGQGYSVDGGGGGGGGGDGVGQGGTGVGAAAGVGEDINLFSDAGSSSDAIGGDADGDDGGRHRRRVAKFNVGLAVLHAKEAAALSGEAGEEAAAERERWLQERAEAVAAERAEEASERELDRKWMGEAARFGMGMWEYRFWQDDVETERDKKEFAEAIAMLKAEGKWDLARMLEQDNDDDEDYGDEDDEDMEAS